MASPPRTFTAFASARATSATRWHKISSLLPAFLSLLIARLLLAYRLLLAVLRLPDAVLPAASRLASDDVVLLLRDAILFPRQRGSGGAALRRKERLREVPVVHCHGRRDASSKQLVHK